MCKLNDLFEAGPQLSATPFKPRQVIFLSDRVGRVEAGAIVRLYATDTDSVAIGLAGPGDFIGLLPYEQYRAVIPAVIRTVPSSQLRQTGGDFKPEFHNAVLRECLRQNRELAEALRLVRDETVINRLRCQIEILEDWGLGYLFKRRASGVKALLAELVGTEPAVISRSLRGLGL